MCVSQAPLVSFLMATHLISSFMPFSAMFPMLPVQVEERGISPNMSGIILGMFSIPTLLLACFFNKIVHKCGRKRLYLSGLYTLTIATLCIGLVEYIQRRQAFILATMLFRLLLGFGVFMTKIVLVPIQSKRFPNKMDKMLTYMFAAIQIGLGVGPFIGSFFYSLLDNNMFFAILIIIGINSCIFIPSAHYMLHQYEQPKKQKYHKKKSTTKSIDRLSTTHQQKTMPVVLILKDMKAIVLFVTIYWHIAYQLFWLTTLATELQDQYNMNEALIGFMFLLRSISSIIASFLVPCALSKYGRPITIYMSAVVHFFAFLFLGPSQIAGIPQNVGFILAAIILKGAADPFMFIPIFPEIIEYCQNTFVEYSIGPISDVVSSIGNIIIEFGVLTSSIFGVILANSFGYRYSCDFWFFLQVPMLILLTFFGGVIPECKARCQKQKVIPLEKQQEKEDIRPPSSDRSLRLGGK